MDASKGMTMAPQNKVQDPTAAALSAIEEALNLIPLTDSDDSKEGTGQSPAARESGRPAEPQGQSERPAVRLPGIKDRELFPRPPEPAAAAKPAAGHPVAPSSLPANDDRRTVGQILQAMQIRSSPLPTVLAAIASLVWVVLAAAYLYTQPLTLAPASLVQPQTALVALATLGPVIFFFVAAALLRRASEMRLTARAMTEVAIRLVEPETVATEQVVNLSQAIRREVASMGDGIERALARASELETIVRSEVSNLERSYTDNERRIRTLIDGLSSEREAIIGNAERVRTAISGAHDTLSKQLEQASGRIAESVDGAGSRVATSLGAKAEEISHVLARTGDSLAELINARSRDLVDHLAATGHEVTAKIGGAAETVSTTIVERIGEVDRHLRETGQSLVEDLDAHGQDVSQQIETTGLRIAETIASSGGDFAAKFIETGNRIHETVTVQGAQPRGSARGDRRSHRRAHRRAQPSGAGYFRHLQRTARRRQPEHGRHTARTDPCGAGVVSVFEPETHRSSRRYRP